MSKRDRELRKRKERERKVARAKIRKREEQAAALRKARFEEMRSLLAAEAARDGGPDEEEGYALLREALLYDSPLDPARVMEPIPEAHLAALPVTGLIGRAWRRVPGARDWLLEATRPGDAPRGA